MRVLDLDSLAVTTVNTTRREGFAVGGPRLIKVQHRCDRPV